MVDIKIHSALFEANQTIANRLMLEVLNGGLGDWALPSTESFRNTILGYTRQLNKAISGLMVNPLLAIDEAGEVEPIMQLMSATIRMGCMIDFGFVPNEILKRDSTRYREDFERGELTHPYENWFAVSRWEGGLCGYFIMHGPAKPEAPHGQIVVVETYGIRVPPRRGVPPHDSVVINDIIVVTPISPGDTRVGPYHTREPMPEAALAARGANSLDPLVTFLAMLANAGIPVTRVPAPAKLNKARARVGKLPIPPHTQVETKDYVTWVQSGAHAHPKGAPQGGTHASPIAHARRAHERRLASGVVVPVRATRVNWRDAEDVRRLFYKLKERTR